ncbi:Uncharacterised protein [uncultured archaeon]|nr:Uncharacterised protein [uncultured archaeon]
MRREPNSVGEETKQEEFEPYGPYKVEVSIKPGGRRIEEQEVGSFCNAPCMDVVSGSRGCYIFCMKVSNTMLPGYIGKATKDFKSEIFSPHKLDIYNSVLTDYERKYKPFILFLIPKKRKGKTNKKAIDELETYLINNASEVNPRLRNKRKIRKPSRWVIKGISSQIHGVPKKELRELKRLIGKA